MSEPLTRNQLRDLGTQIKQSCRTLNMLQAQLRDLGTQIKQSCRTLNMLQAPIEDRKKSTTAPFARKLESTVSRDRQTYGYGNDQEPVPCKVCVHGRSGTCVRCIQENDGVL